MSSPTVSVIIPAYNAADCIGQAIASVLAQTVAAAEIIVVDDGSTDDLAAALAPYGDRVRLVRQVNAGPSSARNHGIREARGELIAFLDADDAWLPEKLAKQLPRFDDPARPGLVYCNYRIIDEPGHEVSRSAIDPAWPARLRRYLLLGNPIQTSTVVIRREWLDRAGFFDESLGVAEDWDLWLRLSRLTPFRGVADYLVNYRLRPGSQSSDGEKNLANELRFLARLYADQSWWCRLYWRRLAHARRYFAAAIALRQAGQLAAARHRARQAIAWWPFYLCRRKYATLCTLLLLRRPVH